MAFSFKLKGGSLQSVVAEMDLIQIKALQYEINIRIDKKHLL